MNTNIYGGLYSMWVMVMFDLPTETKEDRFEYRQFRNFLLDDGFSCIQYSVYIRHAPSIERVLVHERRIQQVLPPGGEVRVLSFTDKQFGKMQIFCGHKRRKKEKTPEQIAMF